MSSNEYFKNKFREELLKAKMKAPLFVWDEEVPIPNIPGLTEHQQEKFNEVIRLVAAGQKRIVLKGSAGVGKLQPYTEPVLTPHGWKIMRDIVPGSLVCCPVTGKSVEVLNVFPGKDLNIYKVTFDDGTWTQCCDDHLWKIQTGKMVNKGTYKVWPLKKLIAKGVKDSQGYNRFRIPLLDSVEFEEKPITIHPYLLGLLLGDGYLPETNKTSMTLTCHSDDCENLFYFIKRLLPNDVTISLIKQAEGTNARRIAFSSTMKKYLVDLGLLGKKSREKFIPTNYLYNSQVIRKSLLAGLMDTDGTCDISSVTRKKVSYCTMSDRLKDDIIELTRSLGGKVSFSSETREKYEGGECFKVSMRLPFNPFVRERKKLAFGSIPYKYNWTKSIVDIEYIRKDEGQCLLLDSKNHLYVTRGYNVTHNTFLVDSLAKEFSRRLIKRWSDNKIYITAPTNKALSILRNKVDAPSVQFSTVHSALVLKRIIDKKTGNASFIPEYSKDKKRPFENCIFAFLDEASMLNTKLLEMLDQFGFPIIFIGDDKQLPPIGEQSSPIFNRGYPEVELTEIVRQGKDSPIIRLSRDLDMIYFKDPDHEDGKGFLYSDNKLGIVGKLAEANGTDDLKYLAFFNDVVDKVNVEVRNRIYGSPNRVELNETIVFDEPYRDHFTNQEVKLETLQIVDWPIKVPNEKTRFNNSGEFLGDYHVKKIKCYIANGNLVIPHEESDLLVQTIIRDLAQACREYKWDWRGFYYFKEQFARFKYNHAITVHKSQGSSYKETVVNVGNIDLNKDQIVKQKMLYTSVTRASNLLILNNVR